MNKISEEVKKCYELLNSISDSDKLPLSDISSQLEYMSKLTEVKRKYKNKIKIRKDGRQYYILINRKQISATTLEGLYAKLFDLEYGRERSSMEDLFAEFMLWKRDFTAASSKTLREYTVHWNNDIKDWDIVKKPICDLKRIDFLNLFRAITKDRTLTKKHFANIKSVLNGIMNYAVEQELILHNPIGDINCKQLPFKPVNHKNDVITIEERQKILEHLENDNSLSSLAIRFDFCMVLRIAELQALKWTDIEGEYIHVQRQRLLNNEMNDDLTFTPKTYENEDHIKGYTDQGFRYIPLIPKAKGILSKVKELNPDGEFIFMENGNQLSTDAFNRKLKKTCKELGLPEYSSHKIRFSSASILYTSGLPLPELQSLLGHTDVSMTLHYIRSVAPKDTTTNIMNEALA